MKLTTRIVLLFFILSFLPVAGLGYLAFANGRQTIYEDISAHLTTTTILKKEAMLRWLSQNQDKLAILAQRPLLRKLTAEVAEFRGENLQDLPAYHDLMKNHLLPNLADGNFLTYSIIRASDAKIIISTEEKMVGAYRESEPYFLNGLTGSYIDNIRYFISEEQVALHISTPILDENENTIAVLSGHVNLNVLTEIMRQGMDFLPDQETYLVNPAFFFVSEPWLGKVDVLKNTVKSEGTINCLNGQNGIRSYLDYRDVMVIGAYNWIPENNVCILTEVDQATALQPLVNLRNQIVLFGIIAAVFTSLLGFFIAKSITAPINQLVEGTNSVGKGLLTHRINLRRKDELGQLASAFNTMSDNLLQSKDENDRLYQETLSWAQELEKRVEARTAELKLSEEKFRSAFEHASIGRAIAKIDGGFVQINSSFSKMLGYNHDELMSMTWQEITHPDFLQANYYFIEKLVAGSIPSYQLEMRFNHKSGPTELVWAKISVFLTCNVDNEPEYLVADIENITENKLADQALQASEDRFRRAIFGAPFPIMIHAEDGEVVLINHAWTNLTGYTQEEISTIDKWTMKAYGQGMITVKEEIESLYDLDSPVSEGEYTIRTSNGDYVIWDFNSAALGTLPDGRRIAISMAMDVTDRKKAELAIQEEKNFSDSLIKSLPEIFYLFDMNGKFLRWNENFEKVSGYNKEEMVYRHPLDFFEGEERESVGIEIQKVFEMGEANIEANFISKNGKKTPYLLTGVRLSIGNNHYLAGTGMDISSRKQMEINLQDSKERYRLLSETSPDMIFVIDRNDCISYVNSFAAEQFGKLPEEVIGKQRTELFPPQVAEDQKLGLQHVFETGQSLSSEAPISFPNGVIWLDTKLVPILDKQQNVTAVMGVSRNITERIKSEEELRSINERFSLATHSAQLGVWDWDIPNNCLVWDDQMYALYEKDKDNFTVSYEAWMDGLHPEDGIHMESEVQEALRGEKQLDTQFRAMFSDGSIKHIKANALVIKDSSGQPIRMTGINYDITERIIAQENLNKANQELARSNAELERFAYVASHDLQEPLRMVASYLQLLERRYKDRLDGDALEFISYAVDGSNRMKTLINDLLAYSRVATRGREFKPIDCNEVIKLVLSTLKPVIEETSAVISYDPLPKILGDETQINQLFQNLIGNAIKFHGDAPPEIHVGVRKEETKWVFSVSDNGIGIDPQFFERIFIIFQRLHNREKYQGTGIGLAISKRIIERHGGRIWIESEPDKGSTFFFSIPDGGLS